MTTFSGAKPDGFDTYWQTVMDELAATPAAPEVEEIPMRSTDFATAYAVRLTSIGPYRIFAYLSIPKGNGPFPAKYFLPRYGSVVDVVPQGTANAQRNQYVTFSLAARGQRGADQPYAASFPGLLTDGIDDVATYIYRGIVADCCRGLEYLAGRAEVDGTRIATIGTDLALTIAALSSAALSSNVTHVVCSPALSYGAADLASRTGAYPLEEINDYLRLHPSRREQVHHTLSYFDLRWFAPQVNSTALLMTGGDATGLNADDIGLLAQAVNGESEVYESQHSGYKDGVYSEEWLTRQFGLETPSLPPHWQP